MKMNRLIPVTLAASSGFLQLGRANVDLGSAATFAVLGNTSVANTGNTVLNGNLGIFPGSSITGFGPGVVNGTIYNGGSVAQTAENDAMAAYMALKAATSGDNLSGQNLGGLTLLPGVYNFTSSAQLTGAITLNANGNPNEQFIFQIGTTFNTANLASVVLENGAQADNVFWEVGSSATVGDGSIIYGNILAGDSVTMDTGADLTGSAVALSGAVTLDDDTMDVSAIPEPSPVWAMGICAAVVGLSPGWKRVRRAVINRLPRH